jgi:D-alanine transaminase
MPIVYLNGEYLPLEGARVSVEDRGFLFADGIYEVVRFYGGRPFRLGAHLRRLQHSSRETRLPLHGGVAELPRIIERVRSENDLHDGEIYVECTRGAAHPRGHPFPAQPAPTLLVMPVPIHALPSDAHTRGLSAVTAPDIRWRHCDVKSIMLLPNVMAKQQARDQGAFEAVFVRDGVVTEGASTNVFAVINGVLRTHPADQDILAGISRQVVLELATELGLEAREDPFTLDQLHAAEEAFLTSTTVEVLPISQVDQLPIGDGCPGPRTIHLWQAFQETTAGLSSQSEEIA